MNSKQLKSQLFKVICLQFICVITMIFIIVVAIIKQLNIFGTILSHINSFIAGMYIMHIGNCISKYKKDIKEAENLEAKNKEEESL